MLEKNLLKNVLKLISCQFQTHTHIILQHTFLYIQIYKKQLLEI